MNKEKTAVLIKFEEATEELNKVKDPALQQFINNAIFVAITKYSHLVDNNKLSCDFDLQFYVELMKDIFANQAFLKGILEGQDYRWPDEEDKNIEEELVKLREKALTLSKQMKAGKQDYSLFEKCFAEGNMSKAKYHLKLAAKQCPIFLGSANNMVADLLIKNNPVWKESIEIFQYILELDPKNKLTRKNLAMSYINFGVYLAKKGQWMNACELQFWASQTNPSPDVELLVKNNLAACYTALGKAAYEEGDRFGAFSFMSLACSYNPNESTQYNVGISSANLGAFILNNENEPLVALNYFRIAQDCGLTLPEIANDIGIVFILLQQWDEAILQFERALELDPNNELTKRNLENAKMRLNQNVQVSFIPRPEFKHIELRPMAA